MLHRQCNTLTLARAQWIVRWSESLVLWLWLACCLGAHGCVSLSPRQAARAVALVRSAQDQRLHCNVADSCALRSPYLPLVDASAKTSTAIQPQHYANLLDQGEDALLLRVSDEPLLRMLDWYRIDGAARFS